MAKSNPNRQARSRVIRFRKSRPVAGGFLDATPPPKTQFLAPDRAGATAGVSLMQDEDGRLHLTRASKDGFVDAWLLLGANGKPLRASPKHRPPDR